MFSLMGNCISCVKKRREPKRPITIAILGLDCAGKTTTTKVLTGESLEDEVAPTIGFNSEKFSMGKFDITMFDLGGGKQIRGVWPKYFAEVYGIIYMIDSTAAERMEELKHNFKELVEHKQIARKPILVLANKQDKDTALDEVDILEQLNLEDTINMHRCPCRVESCSAMKGTGRKMDNNIKQGLQWLCDIIEKNFDTLKPRIEQDMAEAAEKRKIENAAKRELALKLRAEREREEEEERKRLGIEKPESEEEDFVDGDPFKRVDVEELKRREQNAKEEKKRLKELKAKADKEQSVTKTTVLDEEDYLRTPRSNRTYGLSPLGKTLEQSQDDSDELVSSSTARSGRMLPPLQQPLGTKFMEESTTKKKKMKKKVKQPTSKTDMSSVENGHGFESNASMIESQGEKSMRSLSKISVTTKSLNNENEELPLSSRRLPSLDRGEENLNPRETKQKKKKNISADVSSNNEGYELQDVSELTPSPRRPLPPRRTLVDLTGADDVVETDIKKVKKKKKPKKNQLLPLQDDNSTSARSDYSGGNYPWDTPNRVVDDKPHINDPKTGEDFSTKWGLAEELPEIDESALRTRPNYDDDDDIVL